MVGMGSMSDGVKGKLKKYLDKKGMAMPEMGVPEEVDMEEAYTEEDRKSSIQEMKDMMENMGYSIEDLLKAFFSLESND